MTLSFEQSLLNALIEFTKNNTNPHADFKTYINVARSFDDLSNEAIFTDVNGLVIGIAIVYVYVLAMLGGFGCVEQRVGF